MAFARSPRWFGKPALVLIGLGAGLSACAHLPDLGAGPQVNAASPTAAAIRDAIAHPGPYPTFADIPAKPAAAPTPLTTAADLGASRAALLAAAGPVTDTTSDTAAFAAAKSGEFQGVTAPTDSDQAEIEAFAAAQRARATPPSGR